MKEVALEYDIPVFQPVKIKLDYQEIVDFAPDLIVTCAYGQIVPKKYWTYLNMVVSIFMDLYFLSIEGERLFKELFGMAIKSVVCH